MRRPPLAAQAMARRTPRAARHLAQVGLLVGLLACAPLLASEVVGTTGPNARAPLATVGTVLQVSMASTGTILAVTDDPGSSLPAPPNPGAAVATWFIWDRAGAPVHSGSSDLAGCAGRVGDLCQSPATTGAIGADGTRFVVGSTIAMSPLDPTRGMVQAGLVSDGTTVPQLFSNPISQVAIDKRGLTIAVVEAVPPAPGPGQTARSQVSIFGFDGTTLTNILPPYLIPAPAAGLAISADGARVAVAADHLYFFTRANVAPTIITSITGAVSSVSISGTPPHRALAGYASGTLALFTPGTGLTADASMNLPTAITATATSADGAIGLAGEASGKVHLLALNEAAPHLVLEKTLGSAPDAIIHLGFSGDATTALAASATQVHLFQAQPGNLTALWSLTPPAAPEGGGLDHEGNVAAVGVAAGVVVFDASHDVRADTPQSFDVPPRVSRDLDVTYRNGGNRPETVHLGASFPPNWFMTATPDTFELGVGKTATVAVHFVVGEKEPPGLTNLIILHELDSGGARETLIPVRVVPRDAVAFGIDGPASVAMRRGETATFDVTVENGGNADAAVDIQASLNRASWSMSASPRHFDLAPAAVGTFQVSLTAPSDAADGEEAHVRLTIAGRPGAELDLAGVVGARFEPAIQAVGLLNTGSGQTLRTGVTVTNAGNVADSFDLAVSGIFPEGWRATLVGAATARTGLLEPGASETIEVEVQVPEGATGQRVQVKLLATSLGDPTKTDEHFLLVLVNRETATESEGTPGPAMGLVLLSLLAATLLALRRPRAPP